MKVFAYTSSLNGGKALSTCVESVLNQTYPVSRMIVVDNGSVDGTCLNSFPPEVNLVCHLSNLGTSGAAATGFEIALSEECDWIWVLDQDTVAEPDALARMIEIYDSLPPITKSRIGVLCSTVVLEPSGIKVYGRRMTPRGVRPAVISKSNPYYEFDATMWSGCMFNAVAIREIGLPRFGDRGCWEDLALDYGDFEYTFRIKRAGYEVLGAIHSRVIHPVGKGRYLRLGPFSVYSSNHKPFRRYLLARNLTYFWLYLFPRRQLIGPIFYIIYRLIANSVKIVFLEKERMHKLGATCVGLWHGLNRQLDRRSYYNTNADRNVRRYRLNSLPRTGIQARKMD